MQGQMVTIELSVDTIRELAPLGDPSEVLAQLARTVADGMRVPPNPPRAESDRSLRTVRERTDAVIARHRELVEATADEVVRLARLRAHAVAPSSRRGDAIGLSSPVPAGPGAEGERAPEDTTVEDEGAIGDALLDVERAHRSSEELRAFEGDLAQRALTRERESADAMIVDQREANEHMLMATIHARDVADQADAAQKRAEQTAHDLRAVADLREMFIGVLGHDLRNPLNSIIMAANLVLGRATLDLRDETTLRRIVRSGHRITRMISQLLDLTRARLAGGFPLDPVTTDLGEVCHNIVEEFDAPIQLTVEGDVTGVWDPDRLGAVVSNLAGNALQYATPATVVHVTARSERDGVVIAVQNQGRPIPDAALPFIFEPFRRERGGESSSGNLGLGLYIASQIVLAHQGTLDAHCASGTTTFTVRLPRQFKLAEVSSHDVTTHL